MKYAIGLFIFSIAVFSLMSYWGIREPDSEVVFRTTEALATQGTFAVSDIHFSWDAFGLPEGKDGKHYSLFGPGEAIALVPFYKAAEIITATQWYQTTGFPVGISHFTNDRGLVHFATGNPPLDLEAHAFRMVMGALNVILAALCVWIFFLIVKALTRSDQAALLTSLLFAFGSLIFPYSGTCFSELLAMLFVLLSFYLLVYPKATGGKPGGLFLALSGLSLGLATATHITAILFAPFFCIYGAFGNRAETPAATERPARSRGNKRAGLFESIRRRWRETTREEIQTLVRNAFLFSVGMAPVLAWLGYFNFVRFDSIFETGHTLGDQPEYGYGIMVAPWEGLFGLLFSAGKGLLLYCPAVILGLIFWRRFHRKYRFLSYTILAMALLRIVFIATRSDWHGGFGVGPRLLIMLIPFLMLPIGQWIADMIKNRHIKAVIAFAILSFVCIAQQIYFSLGEIFSFMHIIKWEGMRQGINVFQDNLIYLSWDMSPLLYLLEEKRGPWLLNFFDTGNYTLWFILVLIAAFGLFLVYRSALKNLWAKAVVADKKSRR